MVVHLLREVVARLLVGEVEPVLVHQHLLVLEPLPPRFLRHVLEDALAELARIGREIESLGLATELDALDHACHGVEYSLPGRGSPCTSTSCCPPTAPRYRRSRSTTACASPRRWGRR